MNMMEVFAGCTDYRVAYTQAMSNFHSAVSNMYKETHFATLFAKIVYPKRLNEIFSACWPPIRAKKKSVRAVPLSFSLFDITNAVNRKQRTKLDYLEVQSYSSPSLFRLEIIK